MYKILVTGANGFIGRHLCEKIIAKGWQLRGTARALSDLSSIKKGFDIVETGPIGPETDWEIALKDIDTIVHLAAKVRVADEADDSQLLFYRDSNVAGTESLAQMAVQKKVRRFIYISSIKVNGEGKTSAYSELDEPRPTDPYGVSKWEAEQVLQKIAYDSNIDLVVLRPPLVYGPGVKANFLQMLKFIDRGIPLPLSSVQNRRSQIFLGNLVDIIITCISHSKAAGQTFLVSDGQDLSTPDLIRKVALELGKSPRLFSLPTVLLRRLAGLSGKSETADRLLDSLCVDNSKIQKRLNWTPPYTLEQGVKETVSWYLKEFRNATAS